MYHLIINTAATYILVYKTLYLIFNLRIDLCGPHGCSVIVTTYTYLPVPICMPTKWPNPLAKANTILTYYTVT